MVAHESMEGWIEGWVTFEAHALMEVERRIDPEDGKVGMNIFFFLVDGRGLKRFF